MQNRKVDKILIILNLFLVALIILGFGSLIDKNRQLKEDFYSSQLKCLELTIENEKLREQLENITVEELLGIPENWKVVAVTATAYAPLDNKSGICADENPNIFYYTLGREKTGHPAPFPEKLTEDHILSWSNPGDIILDPFIGSGTTGKMAAKHNRYYIGFDISEEYCELARKRIADFTAQQTIFSIGGITQ